MAAADPPDAPATPPTPWWRSGVLYQIYLRSFADSDGDGVGDLGGVLAHLEHLEWLGVDGVWLSPVTVSPNADFGYDVADYVAVDPQLGTLDDLDAVVEEARRRGIRVLLDLVPNHTSDRHAWFVDAASSRTSAHRDWYVWADPRPDGSPPNNWVSTFGGPAWTWHEATGQYYLHNFLPEQPDLNWWNDDVRSAFDDVLRFWWDRGVAGFRIDVCHMIVKDAELRDNPPATADDPFIMQMFGQRWEYNSLRPEVHDVMRRWRKIADDYDPPRVLLGETNVEDLDDLVSFYGAGTDELDLGFNFVMVESEFDPESLRAVVEGTESRLPAASWPVWTGSNHDVSRLATRWASGDAGLIRMALLMLLTLRGTPVLYQGDEIGLQDVPVGRDDVLDPVGARFWPYYRGRDAERSPMPWSAQAGGGFCDPTVRPWLSLGDPAACNVADQRDDPHSVLRFVRDAIALRRGSLDLTAGAYRTLAAPTGVWAWRRGEGTVVILNFGDEPVAVTSVGTPGDLPDGATIVLGTDRHLDGTSLSEGATVGPRLGVVVATS